jgi:hypothetical protein
MLVAAEFAADRGPAEFQEAVRTLSEMAQGSVVAAWLASDDELRDRWNACFARSDTDAVLYP